MSLELGAVTCSISESLEFRKIQRQSKWEVDFNKNYETVAKTIADNITNKLRELLNNRITDSYSVLPSQDSPLKLEYSFKITTPENSAKIKEFAGDAAKLQPFNEWFIKLTDKNDATFDYKYFQSYFQKVGHHAMNAMCSNLENDKNDPENAALDYEIATIDHAYSLNLWVATSPQVAEAPNSTLNVWYSWGSQMLQEGINTVKESYAVVASEEPEPAPLPAPVLTPAPANANANPGYESF